MKFIKLLQIFPLAVLLSFSLTSCSKTGDSDGLDPITRSKLVPCKTYKVGKPYLIKGKRYYPKEDFSYCRKGTASWYGPGFHGKKTAMGTRYNQHAMTAAHPTLQLPCIARVTNLENGKSVVVEINDRGPYCRNREIDLSKKAADLLGFTHKGTAHVEVKVLPKESKILAGKAKPQNSDGRENRFSRSISPQKTVTQSSGNKPKLFVQAGAFSKRENAQFLCSKLQSVGNAYVVPIPTAGQTLYRVRLGPLESEDVAHHVREKVVQTGLSEANIVVEDQL